MFRYNTNGDIMYSIGTPIIREYSIKKSKFIVVIQRIETIPQIAKQLEEIKACYKAANHYCFAYRYHGSERASDDGEPSGTAGIPMLEILKKQALEEILVVVIRYFGGIKLGVGGLMRAYSSCLVETLKEGKFASLQKGIRIHLTCSYEKEAFFSRFFSSIEEKKYQEKVQIQGIVTTEQLQQLTQETGGLIQVQEELFFLAPATEPK